MILPSMILPVSFVLFGRQAVAVQADLEYARAFYESWKPGGGDEILQKYFDALEWIEWNPNLFPRKFGPIERVLLKRSYLWCISSKRRNDQSFWRCLMLGAIRDSSVS